MALPAALAGLAAPAAYPHAVAAIEIIETHMSWVLLTGDYAYKIKRPVCYPFVDMRSFERRAFLCREELRLNRRFAPELYLDVCRITVDAAGIVRINGAGSTVEHAVRMRQFSRAEELDQLLAADRIEPGELERFGSALAALHVQMPIVDDRQPWGRPERVAAQLHKNHAECLKALNHREGAAVCLALQLPFEQRIEALLPWLAARRSAGKVRECHGDLHCRNVVRLASGLTGFDCLEFEPEFRWIDVAEELALLLTDIESRHHNVHAHALLSGYLAASGDYPAVAGLNLYKAHHGLVRAKVAAISARIADNERRRNDWQRECQRLLATAGVALGPHRPILVLICGMSGSGKTWLARQLAASLCYLHLRSDVERKRMAGLAPLAASKSLLQSGLYAEDVTSATYRQLARHGEAILAGGYGVIVDATFSSRAERHRFSELANRLGVPLQAIECSAPVATLRARIAERRRNANDASEADEHVLDWQLEHFEPVTAEENLATDTVDAGAAGIVGQLIAKLTCLQGHR